MQLSRQCVEGGAWDEAGTRQGRGKDEAGTRQREEQAPGPGSDTRPCLSRALHGAWCPAAPLNSLQPVVDGPVAGPLRLPLAVRAGLGGNQSAASPGARPSCLVRGSRRREGGGVSSEPAPPQAGANKGEALLLAVSVPLPLCTCCLPLAPVSCKRQQIHVAMVTPR